MHYLPLLFDEIVLSYLLSYPWMKVSLICLPLQNLFMRSLYSHNGEQFNSRWNYCLHQMKMMMMLQVSLLSAIEWLKLRINDLITGTRLCKIGCYLSSRLRLCRHHLCCNDDNWCDCTLVSTWTTTAAVVVTNVCHLHESQLSHHTTVCNLFHTSTQQQP